MLLFIVLSPGLLLTIPPGTWTSGKTSIQAILVHALVFATAVYFLKPVLEKFQDKSKEGFSARKDWVSEFGGPSKANSRIDMILSSWVFLFLYALYRILGFKSVARTNEKTGESYYTFQSRFGDIVEEVEGVSQFNRVALVGRLIMEGVFPLLAFILFGVALKDSA